MNHAKKLDSLISENKLEEAEAEIERILYFGNTNIEALQLKARFQMAEGEFESAFKTRQRILEIDAGHRDTIEDILAHKMEQNEFLYFTDKLEDGSRRYLVYPKSLTMAAVYGLFGSVVFFLVSTLLTDHPVWSDDRVVLATFGVFVVLPWVLLLSFLFRTLKSITLNTEGIVLEKRLSSQTFRWDEIHTIDAVPQSLSESGYGFLLRFELKMPNSGFFLDLQQKTTSVRARMYFLKQLQIFFPHLGFKRLYPTANADTNWHRY